MHINLLIVVFLCGLLTFKLFHSAALEQIKIIQIKTTLSHVKCGKCGYVGSTLYQLSGYWTCARTCMCVCVCLSYSFTFEKNLGSLALCFIAMEDLFHVK